MTSTSNGSAINDVAEAATLAHLLKYDSVYGPFPGERRGRRRRIVVDGRRDPRLAKADPAELPWGELGVDVVIESTGQFRARADAAKHLEAGARKVIVSAPAKDPDATVVLGVNFDATYDPERAPTSSRTPRARPTASRRSRRCCTRPSASATGLMTTIHAYTGDQRLVDLPHKDLRRARAAAINLVPTSTGAAKAIGLVIPELAGKLDGFAVRVPVPTGSIVDLTIEAARPTCVEEVNTLFRERADARARSRGSSPTARSRSSRPTSSGRRTRRSSTRR